MFAYVVSCPSWNQAATISVDFLRHPQLDDCSVTNILETPFSYFSRRYKIKISLTLGYCFERVFVVSPAHSSRLSLLWRNCLVTVPQSNRLLYGCSLQLAPPPRDVVRP